jgi:hypothetical protein
MFVSAAFFSAIATARAERTHYLHGESEKKKNRKAKQITQNE